MTFVQIYNLNKLKKPNQKESILQLEFQLKKNNNKYQTGNIILDLEQSIKCIGFIQMCFFSEKNNFSI